MSILKCCLCGKKNLRKYEVINAIQLYKCRHCELLQTPRKANDQINSLVATKSVKQDKFRKTSKEDMKINSKFGKLPVSLRSSMHIISEDSNRICRHLKKIIKKFFPKNKKIKFINIGSGYGHVDLILKKNLPQMDMHLLEISGEKMETGRKTFKHDEKKFTFHLNLLDKNFAKKNYAKFDIALSFHVLEHVSNIIDFIKNIFKIVKKGGIIIIEVPNEDDNLLHLSDQYEKHVHVAPHISYFTKKTLLRLFVKAAIYDKAKVDFIGVQRYGFFNYIDWVRYNRKEMVLSDDYIPRNNPSWIEKIWLKDKEKNFTTDSIMAVIQKL
jgi:2-polyprenyl-3-methyl-5-hydroxy-6-metoxy-1,4-benzoquinol methylase